MLALRASAVLARGAPAGEIEALDLAERHLHVAPDETAACALCHIPHQSASIRAAWGGPEAFAEAADDEPLSGSEDYRAPASSVCLSCHDGTLGVVYMKTRPDIKNNHPIGADYRALWLSRPDEYNAPVAGSGIRLVNGRVGCRSCHQLHGRVEGSDRGVDKDRCTSCHRR